MLKTDVKNEIRAILKKNGMMQTDFAKSAGVSTAYISKAMSAKPLKPSFEKLMDSLGYDIEIKFVKKKSDNADLDFVNKIYGKYKDGKITLETAMDAFHAIPETSFCNIAEFMKLLKENGA